MYCILNDKPLIYLACSFIRSRKLFCRPSDSLPTFVGSFIVLYFHNKALYSLKKLYLSGEKGLLVNRVFLHFISKTNKCNTSKKRIPAMIGKARKILRIIKKILVILKALLWLKMILFPWSVKPILFAPVAIVPRSGVTDGCKNIGGFFALAYPHA